MRNSETGTYEVVQGEDAATSGTGNEVVLATPIVTDTVTTERVIMDEPSNEVAGPDRPVCGHFLKSICRHGFVGKGCMDRHPKYCPAFRKWGSTGVHGCKAGMKCERGSHPLMCNESVTRLRCEKPDCPSKLHTIKCIRQRASQPGARHNEGSDDRGQEGRREGWPRGQSVWNTRGNDAAPKTNSGNVESDFRERHQTIQPPMEQIRQEMLNQQQQFQRQMMFQIEQMIRNQLGRGGGGQWRNPTEYNC